MTAAISTICCPLGAWGVLWADAAGERGSPVLLLHGIGSAAASFARQLGELGDRHRVVAWDAPGYGRSDDPTPPFRMDDFADAAAAVLTGPGLGPAHVVGASWGGVIATRLAVRHPALVRSLVLVDSTRGSGRTEEGAAAMLARSEELATAGAVEFARVRAPRLLSAQAPTAMVAAVRELMATSIRLPGYAQAAASMAETDHTEALSSLRVPTLVLVGEHDRVTGVEESRHLHRLVPDSRFAVIPGAGHLAHQEQPDLFNALLSDFLAEQDGQDAQRPGHHPRQTSDPAPAGQVPSQHDLEDAWTWD
ncbi:alpha/beta fold hydrolase [Streptomyces albipurpureus]|uniref:Alpha/beta hydrolase n=1 Tax=Streptomyces albipurpureus TaxID=2897419 RepID=A0ABT0UTS1_9ACTN|nr:alpha/beta fold hydrolase [Streptomyces sp. CWNU-1]MCM2390626.1 alpha/beta hydrolase [Streptomyces sp. CWNU-1]